MSYLKKTLSQLLRHMYRVIFKKHLINHKSMADVWIGSQRDICLQKDMCTLKFLGP